MRGLATALASSAFFISPVVAADMPPHLDTSGVNMQPAYPASALKDGERGAAVIGVNVGETGKVNFAYPMKTSGFDDLDAQAIMGVLGWRFTPATSNGRPAAGDTAVEIVFQPPDSPNSTAQPTSEPPMPKSDFLPLSIEMEAKRGEYQDNDYPVLCPTGTLKTTIEFRHTLGAPAASEWSPVASLMVKTGKNDAVVLQMMDEELFTPPRAIFLMKHRPDSDFEYSRWSVTGLAETLSLSWDTSGLVTGTVGGMETHQTQLKGPPSRFELGISSGAVKFTNSLLVCRAGSAP